LTGTDRTVTDLGEVVTSSTLGRVLRLSGDDAVGGSQDIAPRREIAVEPGRVYRVRVRLARVTDPADPSGHSIELRMQNLTAARASVSNVQLVDLGPVAVVDGVVTRTVAFSLDAGQDYQCPGTTRYALPYLRVYGGDHSTDIAVLSVAELPSYGDLQGLPALADVATSGSYDDLGDKPTLGTAAAEDVEAFATPADLTGKTDRARVDAASDVSVFSSGTGPLLVRINEAGFGDVVDWGRGFELDERLEVVDAGLIVSVGKNGPLLARVNDAGFGEAVAWGDLNATTVSLAVQNGEQMAQWRGKLRQLTGGRNADYNPASPTAGTVFQRNLALIGDSWPYRTNFTPFFARDAFERFGQAGPGLVRLHSATTGNFINYHILEEEEQVTVELLNAAEDGVGDWTTEQGRGNNTLSAGYSASATVGDKIKLSGDMDDAPFDAATLYYEPQTSAAARYRWNAGAWNALDMSTGTALDIGTGIPASGAWTLELEVTAGTPRFASALLDMESANGLRIDKLATGGMDAPEWADICESATFQAQFADRGYDAASITLGTNDQKRHTPAVFAAAMARIIDALRDDGRDRLPIAIVMPCENVGPGHFATMDSYLAAAIKLGAAENVTVYTMQGGFGPDPAIYTAAWPDAIHIDTDTGGPIAAEIYADVLLP